MPLDEWLNSSSTRALLAVCLAFDASSNGIASATALQKELRSGNCYLLHSKELGSLMVTYPMSYGTLLMGYSLNIFSGTPAVGYTCFDSKTDEYLCKQLKQLGEIHEYYCIESESAQRALEAFAELARLAGEI